MKILILFLTLFSLNSYACDSWDYTELKKYSCQISGHLGASMWNVQESYQFETKRRDIIVPAYICESTGDLQILSGKELFVPREKGSGRPLTDISSIFASVGFWLHAFIDKNGNQIFHGGLYQNAAHSNAAKIVGFNETFSKDESIRLFSYSREEHELPYGIGAEEYKATLYTSSLIISCD